MFESQEIETLWWPYIERSVDDLVHVLDDLSSADANWVPPIPDANSVYVLAVHILGNIDEALLGILCGEPSSRDRDAEFRAVGESAIVYERWDDIRSRLPAALQRVTADQLDRTFDHPRRGVLTGREVLLNVAQHATEHLGQARLTRDLATQSRTTP